MALKFSSPPLTIFAPKSPSHRTATEIRFSRWNNANAEKFIRHERAQKEIEDDIRRQRRYESASKIAEYYEDATTTTTNTNADENEGFKSIGTPSSPSRSSIPGKSSKYSKIRNPNPNPNPKISHPAFSRVTKAPKISRVPIDATNGISIGENGVSYRIPNAPFEFQYSYTETPKVKPLALREPPFVPFGPSTMPRPWTGRAPLPPSKKKLPEFDSFRLPPPHKKGVKPVQAPGPFLAGMGPKLVKSREEILGETLTEEEIKALVQGCLKSRRQLNMGRDGLTHNMLDNIHAHWKRRRVCKIKCKGVCTIDMDNVRQQLEEKTGGKIIYSRGGVLFLFRGRNYNYRTRPRYPLMLWKPVTPVYPRLIQQAPEGLELEEAREMRKRGRKLPPLCKLGKNGVYSDLVKHIREAFEECELVRINCEGMNGSDHRKIGAKLKDLVPCVLISFENEHILMWRGREWKSSFSKSENECKEASESETDGATIGPPNYTNSLLEGQQETSELCAQNSSKGVATLEMPSSSMPSLDSNTLDLEGTRDLSHSASEDGSYEATDMVSSIINISESSAISETIWSTDDHSETMSMVPTTLDSMGNPNKSETIPAASRHLLGVVPASNGVITNDRPQSSSLGLHLIEVATSNSNFMEGVTLLWKQAIESGSAVVLDDTSLDANIVYNRAVTLAKGTPPGPVFKQKHRKVAVRKDVEQKTAHPEVEGIVLVSEKRIEKKSSRNQRVKDFKGIYPDILPHGSLGVDELAKLLG